MHMSGRWKDDTLRNLFLQPQRFSKFPSLMGLKDMGLLIAGFKFAILPPNHKLNTRKVTPLKANLQT